MSTQILGITFFDKASLQAASGELEIIGINSGSWSFDLSGEGSLESSLYYANGCGSLISNGCNIELNGQLIGTTEY